MRSSLPIGLVAPMLIASANAHTTFTTLFVNDVSQGDATCVRMSMDRQTTSYPIASIDSDYMACGLGGNQPVAFTCPAPAGGKLSFEYRVWADASHPGALDPGHKGPCAVYAKQVQNITTDSPAGSGWVKIWDDGYDDSTGKWCTEKLIDNNGLLSIDLPEYITDGYWLIRPELLALHQAVQGNPQFYVGCAQVYVEGNNATAPNIPEEHLVSIPGYVKSTDPGLTFNIWSPKFPYTMPGPKAYQPASTGKSVLGSASSLNSTLIGDVPPNYLIKNANWVGVEVPDYTTESGCWNSSEACWAQAKVCYDSAPPTGDANCHVWEDKCNGIVNACNSKNFNGPPNKGQKLQSKEPAVPGAIPAAVNARRSTKLRVRRARGSAVKFT
ncbi:glycoside hydrolase family 61 protein [Rostrohypoxylon terebratum]|nr:glycoside hydrolase family 61 protein [Rostrohypoxylon terebratum]